MLRYDVIKDGVQITPEIPPPRVYLDCCALSDFSDSRQDEGRRFIHILKRKKGTLYFSWIHIVEYFNNGPGRSYRKLLKFLDKVGPHWGLLDCEYEKVLEKERSWSPGKQGPHIDDTMIREVFLSWYRRRSWLVKKLLPVLLRLRVLGFTPTVLFDEITRHPEEYNTYRELAASMKTGFKQTIDNARDAVRKNPTARNNFISQRPRHTRGAPPTDYIRDALYKKIVLGNDNFELNDGPDLLHAVTATAYSEFVVFDGKWAKRLKEINLPSGVASVYDIKEIESFLDDFKNYQEAST